MITKKQKAKQLFEKAKKALLKSNSAVFQPDVKKLAISFVKEILKANPYKPYPTESGSFFWHIDKHMDLTKKWWEGVIEEIKKI